MKTNTSSKNNNTHLKVVLAALAISYVTVFGILSLKNNTSQASDLGIQNILATTPIPTATNITPSSQIYTFNPSEDAYTRKSTATTNYGKATSLFANKVATDEYRSYLKFQIRNVSRFTNSQAKLRLYLTDGSVNAPALYNTTASWSETGVKWNNQPALPSTPVANLAEVSSQAWVEYDVSATIKRNSTFTFILASENGVSDGITAFSREGANKPEIVVTSN